MAATTGKAVTFSLRKCVFAPADTGAPIVIDTPQEASLTIAVTLEELRAGAYVLPVAAAVKEKKVEVALKLVDAPLSLVRLGLGGSYSASTTTGGSIDELVALNNYGNNGGNSWTAGLTASVSASASVVNERYALQATGANAYTVTPLSTGVVGGARTIPSSAPYTDSVSAPGVTLTFSQAAPLTTGDAAVLSTAQTTSLLESASDVAQAFSLTTTFFQADAYWEGQLFDFVAYRCAASGVTYPLKVGSWAIDDLKLTVLTAPPGSSLPPYRLRRVS